MLAFQSKLKQTKTFAHPRGTDMFVPKNYNMNRVDVAPWQWNCCVVQMPTQAMRAVAPCAKLTIGSLLDIPSLVLGENNVQLAQPYHKMCPLSVLWI